MKCSNCGYKGNCKCEFENGLCLTCFHGGKKVSKGTVDNYCEQTLENLNSIREMLIKKEQSPIVAYQISVINSQIKMFDDKPCKFKQIIDQILLN